MQARRFAAAPLALEIGGERHLGPEGRGGAESRRTHRITWRGKRSVRLGAMACGLQRGVEDGFRADGLLHKGAAGNRRALANAKGAARSDADRTFKSVGNSD